MAQRFGAPRLIPLDVPLQDAAQLSYIDLLPKQAAHRGAGIHAVAEHQGSALLYLVDDRGNTRSLGPRGVWELQRLLANRSDSAWLGIVRDGSLDLYPVKFAPDAPAQPSARLRDRAADAPLFFQSLVHGTFSHSEELPASDHVYKQILSLLSHTTETYVPGGQLDGLEVLSMTGRALFFRFLHDRRIIEPSELADICPSAAQSEKATLKDCFSTPRRAAETSAWLDKTFNGDFLPLPLVPPDLPSEDEAARRKAYLTYYHEVEARAGRPFFRHLSAIMHGWEAVGITDFQPEFDWNEFQFAHIPVGVLSEVYEHFCHKVDARLAADTSVHYTPRFIAQFMVREAFTALPQPQRPTARVLDPSCGAGIFLVLAFRKLFEALWQAKGERPGKEDIQNILYQQLRGFDVSESALRLSALALYITAIELNATQRPPSELKMPKNLRGAVLHHFGQETAREVYGPGKQAEHQGLLGSLGDLPRRSGLEPLDGTFDLVIGNPPWTRLRDESPAERRAKGALPPRSAESASQKANKAFTAIAKRVLESRGLPELAENFTNPDKAPDIPFLWRAAEWAKTGGIIAFAMHARLFLHTQGKKDITWQAALRAFSFTGIINGADLRKTPVWEEMDVPWCLAFARNQVPAAASGFFFSTPAYERAVNGTGRFRIDYASINPLRAQDISKRPWLLKTLTLGTLLDVEVMGRITSAFDKSLEQRWDGWDETPDKDRTGQGYNRSPGLKQTPAPFLGKLKDFKAPANGAFAIHWDDLKTYGEVHGVNKEGIATAYRTKTPEQYEPPLVIIPKAPGDAPCTPKAFLADQELAFSQSYYGYSCKSHPETGLLASLIHVLAHSTLARYFILMRSASLGSDFMMFLKTDFDALPFPDVSSLTQRQKRVIQSLSERLVAGEGMMPPIVEEPAHRDLFAEHEAEMNTRRAERARAERFWNELNQFVFDLYRLRPEDVRVIEDTLYSSAPYRRAGEDAFLTTEPVHRRAFCEELQARLQPFFDVTGEVVQLAEPPGLRQQAWDHSWRFIAAWTGEEPPSVPGGLISAAMRDANDTGASIVTIRAHGRGLLIGILDARRWWTRSRALLCARHILQDKLPAFDAPVSTRHQ